MKKLVIDYFERLYDILRSCKILYEEDLESYDYYLELLDHTICNYDDLGAGHLLNVYQRVSKFLLED